MCGLMCPAISHSWHHHRLTEALTGAWVMLVASTMPYCSRSQMLVTSKLSVFQIASESIAYFRVQSQRGLGKNLKSSTTRYWLPIQYVLRDDAWRLSGCSSFIPSDLQSSIHVNSHISDHRSRRPCLSLVILVHLPSFYSIFLSTQVSRKRARRIHSHRRTRDQYSTEL
jgi:hypothetical protein